MTRIIPGVTLAVMTMGTTEGATQLLEQHSIGLPTLCSIGAVVFTAGFWLAGRITKLDDRIEALNNSLQGLWCVRNRDSNGSKCKGKGKQKRL